MEPLTLGIAATTVIVVAALLSRRTGIAAPLVLLVIGFGIGMIPAIPDIELEPEWILVVVLPPLLYASAVRVPVMDLRRNVGMIAWLSVTLVIVSALAVGVVVHWLIPDIPLAAAVALGAVVAPTDAVAATSIGKRLGLPRRLMTVLEGESLVNDASALVLLRTAIAAVAGAFSLGDAVLEFARAAFIAAVIGVAIGYVTVWVRSRLNDPVLTTAVSFVVPFLAFLPAEHLGTSGVVAVVAAGLVTGHLGARLLSARERSTERTNWATLQFLIENGVFLLMGLQLHVLIADLTTNRVGPHPVILIFVVLALLAIMRTIAVALYVVLEKRNRPKLPKQREAVDRWMQRLRESTSSNANHRRRRERLERRLQQGRARLDFLQREPIGGRGGVILSWAGMRGVVTVAAALTIPTSVPHRSLLVAVAFGVAAVSLLGFGGTLPALIKRLGVRPADSAQHGAQAVDLLEGLGESARSRFVEADPLMIDGQQIDDDVLAQSLEQYKLMAAERDAVVGEDHLSYRQQHVLVSRAFISALREGLHAERAIGGYPTEVFERAEAILDAEELRLDR